MIRDGHLTAFYLFEVADAVALDRVAGILGPGSQPGEAVAQTRHTCLRPVSAAAAHLRRRGVRRARDRRTARSRYHFAVEQSSIARGEFLELTIIAILVFELIPLVSGLLK